LIAEIEHLLGNLSLLSMSTAPPRHGYIDVRVSWTSSPGESLLILHRFSRTQRIVAPASNACGVGRRRDGRQYWLFDRKAAWPHPYHTLRREDWHNRRSLTQVEAVFGDMVLSPSFRKVCQCPASVERRRGGHVENGLAALSLFQRARRRPLGFAWTLTGFYLGAHVSDIKAVAHDLERRSDFGARRVDRRACLRVQRLRHRS